MRKTFLLAALLLAPFTMSVAPSTLAAETAATQTATLAVENMNCAACPITVRKALEKVPGVAKAKVNLDAKTATVTFDSTKTNVEALTRATTEAGYPSKVAQ